LIGHPIETLFIDVPTHGNPDINVGGEAFSVPISRSMNFMTEPLLEDEPIEEVMAIFPHEPHESIIKGDAQPFTREEDNLGETLEPPDPPDPSPDPFEEAFLTVTMEKEWLREVRRSSKLIQISSPSNTMPSSIGGTAIDTLHNPTVEANIMSEYLAESLLGDVSLEPADMLFKSPSGLIFEGCKIARAVPIEIDQTKVFLDFHIFPILEFDLLIGYPLEQLHLVGASLGSQKPREHASTTTSFSSKSSMVKPHAGHEMLEEVKFVSPFTSINPLRYEDEKLPDHDKDELGRTLDLPKTNSTMIPTNEFFEKENLWDMEILEASTLDPEEKNFINEHESFFLEKPQDACSFSKSPKSATLCAKHICNFYNPCKTLFYKMFFRMVVDAFVYHKYCKSRCCIYCGTNLAAESLNSTSTIGGEAGNYITNDSCNMKIPGSSL
jgi:hypothetical protein